MTPSGFAHVPLIAGYAMMRGGEREEVAAGEAETRGCGKTTPASRMIRLNVGGQTFETAVSTLRQGGAFFESLLSGSFCDFDANGVAFIDRDPAYFKCILQFLRSGCFELPPPLTVEGALAEAHFFLIEPLIELLQERISAEKAESASQASLRFNGCYVRVAENPEETEAFQFIEGPCAEGSGVAAWPEIPRIQWPDIGGGGGGGADDELPTAAIVSNAAAAFNAPAAAAARHRSSWEHAAAASAHDAAIAAAAAAFNAPLGAGGGGGGEAPRSGKLVYSRGARAVENLAALTAMPSPLPAIWRENPTAYDLIARYTTTFVSRGKFTREANALLIVRDQKHTTSPETLVGLLAQDGALLVMEADSMRPGFKRFVHVSGSSPPPSFPVMSPPLGVQ